MSKTLISVLVLAAVIVGGYFIIKHGKGSTYAPAVDTYQNTMDNTASDTAQNPDTTGKKIAFSEFIKHGGTYKCTVKQAMSDFENSGTVYIDGANIRGDFSTIAEGRPMKTSFVTKDGFSYTWSPDMPNMGFKVKVGAADGVNTPNWPEQIGDYSCSPWAADASVFTLPANVTFKEAPAQ